MTTQAEIIEDRREQRTETLKQKEVMQGLLSSPGWIMLAEFLRVQIAARDGQLYSNAGCPDVDYLRGEGGALRLVLGFPQAVINQADATIGLLGQELTDGAPRSSTSQTDDDTSGWTDDD